MAYLSARVKMQKADIVAALVTSHKIEVLLGNINKNTQ
jgi:hypothetical protein